MTGLIESLLNIIKWIWPLEKVPAWAHGVQLRFGAVRRVCKPGAWYWNWWWVEEMLEVSIVPAIISTGRKDIETSDGERLTFEITGTVYVTDPVQAHTCVDQYTETSIELLTAVVCDKLADVDAKRLDPDARRRLLSDLARWVNKAADEHGYGFAVRDLSFTTFVRGVRMFRIIGEAQPLPW